MDAEVEIAVERRSTILPPPLRSEVAELDLELLAAYARTDGAFPGPLEDEPFASRSSDTELVLGSDAPATVIPPAPPPAIGLGLWML